MPWDVLIAHASEEKESVARPLKAALEKAGISVWIDEEQIRLGDGLAGMIDHGLANCRFGVVILSPSFFNRRWTRKELDALSALEVKGRKVIIPVLYELKRDELQEKSPLLAGTLCADWAEGIAAVVQKITTVVLGSSESVIATDVDCADTTALKSDSTNLALLHLDGCAYVATIHEAVMTVDQMTLVLRIDGAEDIALVTRLGNSKGKLLGVAFGLEAHLCVVESIVRKRTGTVELANVQVKVDDHKLCPLMEMSYNALSADELAEMRARRLLLDEKLASSGEGDFSVIQDALLDVHVSGVDVALPAKASPFPRLYRTLKNHPEHLVSACQLFAVLHLRLSGTVEHVLALDLKLLDGARLGVRFRGQRARRYSKVAPHIIEVRGECDLGSSADEDPPG